MGGRAWDPVSDKESNDITQTGFDFVCLVLWAWQLLRRRVLQNWGEEMAQFTLLSEHNYFFPVTENNPFSHNVS